MLADFQQQRERELQRLRERLQGRLEAFAEEEIAKIRETIRKSNEDAIARFNQGMGNQALMEIEGRWPPILLESNEKLLKNMLESTLDSNKKLLDGLIAKIQRDLQGYRERS